ncbi:hypothetical protein HN448_01280 [archaeon]|nr:hypothetical protein [archaeon]
MKKISVMLILFLALTGMVFAADFDQVSDYAQQYENGELDYLKFKTNIYVVEEQFYEEIDGEMEKYSSDSNIDPAYSDEILELGKEAEIAFMDKDAEKLKNVVDELIVLFQDLGDEDTVEVLKEITEAADNSDWEEISNLASKLPQMNSKEEGDYFKGLSIDFVEDLFGSPSGYQEEIWIDNDGQSTKLDEKVPYFENVLFDGDKVRVTLHAWPNGIKDGNEILLFYHVGIQSSLQTEGENVDIGLFINSFQEMVDLYENGDVSLSELGEAAANVESNVNNYINTNPDECSNIFSGLLSRKETVDVTYITGTIVDNDDLYSELSINHDVKSDEDNFHIWAHIESRNKEEIGDEHFDSGYAWEDLHNNEIEEVKNGFIEMLDDVVDEIKSSNSASDARKEFYSQEQKLNNYLSELNWRAQEDNDITSNELEDFLYDTVNDIGLDDLIKQKIERIEYKDYLIKETVEINNAWCRSEEEQCDQNFYCEDAQCVSAQGGDEDCTNGQDDDGDTYWDCDDPDCDCEQMWEEENQDDGWFNGNDEESNHEESECKDGCEQECGDQNTDCVNDKCVCLGNDDSPEQGDDNNEVSECKDGCEQECGDQNTNCIDGMCICLGYGENGPPPNDDNDDSNNDNNELEPAEPENNEDADDSSNNEEGNDTEQDNGETDQIDEDPVGETEEQVSEPTDENSIEEGNDGEVPENNNEPESDSHESEPVEEESESESVPSDEGNDDSSGEQNLGTSSLITGMAVADDYVWFEDLEEEDDNQNYNDNKDCDDDCKDCWECDWENGDLEQCDESCKVCNLCQYENGDLECYDKQFFDEERGHCECEEGYSDCDGDWLNGCELEGQCDGCQSDRDCAEPKCSEDKKRILNFACESGDSWEEDKELLQFGANCDTYTNGDEQAGFWIDGWGEELEQFGEYKHNSFDVMEDDWCKKDLEKLIEERKLIQESFNEDFMDWFFNEFVNDDPNKFEDHMRIINGLHRVLMENTDRTAWTLACLGETEFPEEYMPIQLSYQSIYGDVEIWEEYKKTDHFSQGGEDINVLNPYMKIWIFPPKEFIIEKMNEEFGGPKGPPAHEVAEIQQNEEIMDKINKISDRFDDGAEIIFQIKDEEELVFQGLMKVNPEVVMRIEQVSDYDGTQDAIVSVDFDFLYDIMSTVAKEVEGEHVEGPWWEKEKGIEMEKVKESWVAVKVIGQLVVGLTSGEIEVEPTNKLDDIIFSLTEIVSLMSMGE